MIRKVVIGLIMSVSAYAGTDIKENVQMIKVNKKVSLELLNFLMNAKGEDKIGYGLCRLTDARDCTPIGGVGYGVCRLAGESNCFPNGSIGYGLCRAAGHNDCTLSASIGYGICRVAGHADCMP